MKNLTTRMIWILVGVTIGISNQGWANNYSVQRPIPNEQGLEQPLHRTAQIDTPWRFTNQGWQNMSDWPVVNRPVRGQAIERLHPLVWSGLVLFATIAIVIWSSSEWEIARLFRRD